jgi:hypothetical protein
MLRWAAAARLGHGVFTSNVDGHFLRAGASQRMRGVLTCLRAVLGC